MILPSCCAMDCARQAEYRNDLLELGGSSHKNVTVAGTGSSFSPVYFVPGESCTIVTECSSVQCDLDKLIELKQDSVCVPASMNIHDLFLWLRKYSRMVKALPSYPGVSVGGCVAADVHGQNHFGEGCFGEHVLSLELAHPDFGLIECSPNINPDIFTLTIGGLGITGQIKTVTLKIYPMVSEFLDTRAFFTSSLIKCYEKLKMLSGEFDYLHCQCFLNMFGKNPSIIRAGSFSKPMISSKKISRPRSIPRSRGKISFYKMPCVLCFGKAFLILRSYFAWSRVTLYDFIFPSARKTWYFSLFGPEGFVERQVLIPDEVVGPYFLEFEGLVANSEVHIALSHMKFFDREYAGHAFNGFGCCFAFHYLPSAAADRLCKKLDELNEKLNCRVNLVKDSRLTNIPSGMSTELNLFFERVRRVFGDTTFQSAIWRRVIQNGR